MTRLRRLGVLVAHETRLLARDPLPALVLIVFPLILMAFLKPAFRDLLVASGHPHANGAEQVVPGEAVTNAFFIVSLTAFAFFAEWGWATWDRLRTSAATSLEIMTGKALPRFGLSLAQFAVIFLVAVPLFGLHISGTPAALVPPVVAFAASLVLLGVAVTALTRTVQQATAFTTIGLVVFGAIGGALVPYQALPPWAQHVAPLTPTYWAMRGFHAVILDRGSYGATLLPTAVLTGMALLFATVALLRFRVDERKLGWS